MNIALFNRVLTDAIGMFRSGNSVIMCNEVMKMKHELLHTLDFGDITLKDVPRVGGKNASLGELYNSLK